MKRISRIGYSAYRVNGILFFVLLATSCQDARQVSGGDALPEIIVRGAEGALDFGKWRWVNPKPEPDLARVVDGLDPDLFHQRKLVSDMVWEGKLIDLIEYTFFKGDEELGRDSIPGNIFLERGKRYTRYFPSGFSNFAIAGTTKLMIDVRMADATPKLKGMPDGIVRAASACERGMFRDCTELAVAFRGGVSSLGEVEGDMELAAYYGDRMISIGQEVCDAGNEQGCFFYAVNVALGRGCPKSERIWVEA